MSANWGRFLKLTIFGESHGAGIGIVVDGIPPNIKIDKEQIQFDMNRRAPGNDPTATARKEPDKVVFVSGIVDEHTTGAPICGMIRNTNTRSQDYENVQSLARPSHADYTGFQRFQGANDVRGGGHFSGRLTAPIVFAGALVRQWLQARYGIAVGAHIQSVENIVDCTSIENMTINELDGLRTQQFPLLDKSKEILMRDCIETARMAQDSVGGTIQCIGLSIPVGIGSPFFDSLESNIAHLAFSVPAVKGIEFGSGFSITTMHGSQANDALRNVGGAIITESNHNGGINGGISNGMPIVFRVAIKPTASISIPQETIDYRTHENEMIQIKGRHDPCIVLRAVPVIESCLLLALGDALLEVKGQWGD